MCQINAEVFKGEVQRSHAFLEVMAIPVSDVIQPRNLWKFISFSVDFCYFLSAEMCCPSRCSYQTPSPKPQHTGSWRPSHTWDKVQ